MAFLTGQSLLMLKSQYTVGAPQNKDSGAVSQTDLYNQSLVSSVVQAKLLACCYGFMSEFVTSAQTLFCSNSIRDEQPTNNSFRNQVGVICVKKLHFQALHVLLEKGNVDDDATLITIFLVSFNLQSCCLMQSANVIHRCCRHHLCCSCRGYYYFWLLSTFRVQAGEGPGGRGTKYNRMIFCTVIIIIPSQFSDY